jgi:hypothetical protein
MTVQSDSRFALLSVSPTSSLDLSDTAPTELFSPRFRPLLDFFDLPIDSMEHSLSPENPGDPWDHPEVLASIDELCSKHFHSIKSAAAPPPPFSRPFLPSKSASTSHLSATSPTHLPSLSLVDKPPTVSPLPSAAKFTTGSQLFEPPTHHKPLQHSTPHKNPGSQKRTQKVWKPKRKHPKLVLGMDIGLPEACNLALCALVGRLAYKLNCKQNIEDWMEISWKPLLGYLPKFFLLQQGWLGFVFKTPADSTLILGDFWPIDGGSLMLKRWRLGFNPATEYFGLRHLWVLLPGLPLQLWNLQALERIGASLGRFLKIDSNLLEAADRRIARIYVELDIQAGLPEVLEIDWRGQLISQRLDFLGIPFRCSFAEEQDT